MELHPKEAVVPPDIQTYKAFLEFYARNTDGRLDHTPTVSTAEGFRRDFETAWARDRNYSFPDRVSRTLKDVRFFKKSSVSSLWLILERNVVDMDHVNKTRSPCPQQKWTKMDSGQTILLRL